MPRRDRTRRKPGPPSGSSLAWRCFKAAVNQVHSVIAAGRQRPVQPLWLLRPRLEPSLQPEQRARIAAHRELFRTVPWNMRRPRPSSRRARPSGPSYPSGVGSSYVAVLRRSRCRARHAVGPRTESIRPQVEGRAAANGNGASSSLPGNKTSYQTRRQDPDSRLARRPVRLPKTTVSTPEPTSRSAQARRAGRRRDSSGADDQDPLDHLPPLDLPGEVTKSAATPPVPPAADRNDKPALCRLRKKPPSRAKARRRRPMISI